ncbi:MAG: DUF1460 domain-containing protein [Bacteroidota bacterium]|nr:DUF1460 domain-containing protein [Bacteroidota bacterium]MDP4204849.1 DUF1460 domain-containing protein [Bacteroidota bacterium]
MSRKAQSQFSILMLSLFLFCTVKMNPVKADQYTILQKDSVYYTMQDVHIFEKLRNDYSKGKKTNKITQIGRFFLNSNYFGHTLEGRPERLRINLIELDCVTFVENVVVLNRVLNQRKPSFKTYCDTLRAFRYRNGNINGYGSRLHYFSDWMIENQEKGRVEDMTQKLGGIPYNKTINYMSAHSEIYPLLKDSVDLLQIKKAEDFINQHQKFYIPTENIDKAEKDIKDGDVIALVPKLEGLDITHVGLAILLNGQIHFMHASSEKRKVIISDLPLTKYLEKNKNVLGIMVIRTII